jgi:hypothetical protein
MSDVVNKTTLQYLKSVNTTDYPANEWWINPVIPGVAKKYWKNDNENLVEMSQAEKDAVDQSEADALAAAEEATKDINNAEPLTKALALVVGDLTGKTAQEMKTLIRSKL